MSDLWVFNGRALGAAAPIRVDTERIDHVNTGVHGVPAINLDQGMVAKIWELQLEGGGERAVRILYSKDSVTGVITDGTWETLKVFSKPGASTGATIIPSDPQRHEKINRPIVAAEAWNTTTWIMFWDEVVAYAVKGDDAELTAIIEFDEIDRQP